MASQLIPLWGQGLATREFGASHKRSDSFTTHFCRYVWLFESSVNQSSNRVDGNTARVGFTRDCETFVMPQVRQTGTAWDRRLDDYAYARGLPLTGWAWEFLRRNAEYRRDRRLNRAGHPVAIHHVSGATLYRPQRRFLAAEDWGLELFADPDCNILETDVFWLSDRLRHCVHCQCKPSNDNPADGLSLASFRGRRAVLAGWAYEHMAICAAHQSADMIVSQGSILFGTCAVTFLHKGLETAFRHHETLSILRSLTARTVNARDSESRSNCKYLDYLVALDGHLEGRSYRDIAVVLYGKDRVGAHWNDDTRWMKSKVRRAVDRGLALMNGGYRELL